MKRLLANIHSGEGEGEKNGHIEPKKQRQCVKKMYLPTEYFSPDHQDIILSQLREKNIDYPYYKCILSQLECKLGGYKHQDVLKKRFCVAEFVDTEHVIQLLNESTMLCQFCKCQLFLLYDIVRETRQWTLDRINNDLGHNVDNVMISCLACNLKRRRTNKDSFLFTKQLNVVRFL